MLNPKRIKPIGSQILVTKNEYAEDEYNEAGIIVFRKGDLKTHQTVVAVGDDVKFVKVGDLVEINLYKYAIMKEDPNSIRAGDNNPIIGLRLNDVELQDDDKKLVPHFIIDQRDVQYIIEDFAEVAYKPKKNLILPNTSFKL